MAMQARISTIEGDAGKIDDAVKIINEKIILALKGLQGFTAVNFLADRSAGKLVAVGFSQTRPRSKEASRPSAQCGLRWQTRWEARSPASNPTNW